MRLSLNTIVLVVLALLVLPGKVLGQEEGFPHPELDWYTIETEHFYVHYHQGVEPTARVVAKIAEDIYGPVTSLYNHEPDQKVSFVLKDYDDYSNGATYFYDNKVEIWVPALDFELRGTTNWLRNVVTHEFTHIVQVQTAMKFGRRVPGIYLQWLGYEAERRPDVLNGFPNVIVSYPIPGAIVPAWFAEGVAQYNRPELGYDSWDSHRDMILRMYVLDGKMLSWNQMAVFGKTSFGNESSYNAGFSFVHYLAARYGEEKLNEISRNLGRLPTLTIDGAIERATGKSGRDIYEEWKSWLTTRYEQSVASIKTHLVAGEIISDVGFGNLYPAFSPDGKRIAYVSTKEQDYFSLASLYVYDFGTKEEKHLVTGVSSSLAWSPDGRKIYYAKATRENKHWSSYNDIYVYDLESKEETRLTHARRAKYPAISPSGDRLACVVESDGTANLVVMAVDGTSERSLTSFKEGEQVYTPAWSPDGSTLVFGYSDRKAQRLASISAQGTDFKFLTEGPVDSRNPTFSTDGKRIVFSSDRTGIFNLYSLDISSRSLDQLTNVLGGAFMPTVDSTGDVAFASYTSSGYKIALLRGYQPLKLDDSQYALRWPDAWSSLDPTSLASASHEAGKNNIDWTRLRDFDDSDTWNPAGASSGRPYKNVFTSLSILPLLRVDNYNSRNRGLDVLKPGFFFLSNDVLDKYGIFGGAAINKRGERDLFFTFDYRDKVPLLYDLGLDPTVEFGVYNISRSTGSKIELPLNTIDVDVTYSLLEFDVSLQQKIFTPMHDLRIGYTHSRYNASVESFILPGPPPALIPASSDLYLIGNNLSVTWDFDGLSPSRYQEINPVGTKFELKYSYEFSKFNSTGDYEVTSTGLQPRYTQFNFHRLEGNWMEHLPLPDRRHTMSVNLRGGSIFGPRVDDFFDFYVGGLIGMKGYPYYGVGGNKFAMANLTYRFPVWEDIDTRVLQLYFDKLYAGVYGDYGDAWSGDAEPLKDFKKDAGVELRLEGYSFYAYPTRVFFDACYGFDRFTRVINGTSVTYGREWRLYFGVLFGFDLM
ncbi:MAG: biopolymer transporter Tol [Bacteroidota bacterium]